MKKSESIKETKRGITLVALVVTIVVMLILAGVSITALLGDEGIIAKANDIAKLTKRQVTVESIQIDILTSQLEGDITKEKLEEILGGYGEIQYSEDNITGLKVAEIDEIIPIEELYSGNIETTRIISFTLDGFGTYEVEEGTTWYDVINSPLNNEWAEQSGLINEGVLYSYEYGYMFLWGEHGDFLYCPPAGAPTIVKDQNKNNVNVDDEIKEGYTYRTW